MHFGFSYMGLIFLILLMVSNLFWTKNQPENYEKYVVYENKKLVFLASEPQKGNLVTE